MASLSDQGKKALLKLCYLTVRRVGPKHNSYDSMMQATFAEALYERIEQYIKAQPSDIIVEFEVEDADTYDYFCEILDELQQTLPFMDHFNVKLVMNRLIYREGSDATTAIDGYQRGGSQDLDL